VLCSYNRNTEQMRHREKNDSYTKNLKRKEKNENKLDLKTKHIYVFY
jgi:hypothetical protein